MSAAQPASMDYSYAAIGTSTPPSSTVLSCCLIIVSQRRISLAFGNVSCIALGEVVPRVAEEARHESIGDGK